MHDMLTLALIGFTVAGLTLLVWLTLLGGRIRGIAALQNEVVDRQDQVVSYVWKRLLGRGLIVWAHEDVDPPPADDPAANTQPAPAALADEPPTWPADRVLIQHWAAGVAEPDPVDRALTQFRFQEGYDR